MKAKRIALRREAVRSIDSAVAYYLEQGGRALASRFISELQQAYRHIRRHPATGALRYARELDIPGLRFWPLDKFPYLVFYMDRDEHVDVLLVLHTNRDIPALLQEPR